MRERREGSGDQAAQTRLQRIAAGLRNREWANITIEVLVVTLGVLLAFQIDQWGQNRRQAREERQFLERMWRETGQAVAENEWAMTMHGRFRREFIDGFRALNDERALLRLASTPNVGCRSNVNPPLGFNTTSFQELSASGRLNIVSDPEIRAAMRDVVAAQANANELAQRNEALMLDNQRTLSPYVVLGLDENDNRTCRMDWPRLATDQAARRVLVSSVRLHSLLWMQRAWVRDRLAIAHNRIACALHKPDCQERVSQILGSRPLTDLIPPEAQDDVERSAETYNGS